MRPSGVSILLASLTFAVVPAAAAPAPPPVPLVVIDHVLDKAQLDGDAVSFLDPDALTVLGTVQVGPNPRPIAYDASGSRLFVVVGGQASGVGGKGADPYRVCVVDVARAAPIGCAPIGLPPVTYVFSGRDLRLYTIGRGAKKKDPATLYAIDLSGPAVDASVPLPMDPADLELNGDGTRLFVLLGDTSDRKGTAPARLIAYDARDLKLVAEHASAPRPARLRSSADGTLMYALCRGAEAGEGTARGRLHVLDGGSAESLASIELGFDAGGLAIDSETGRVFVFSGGLPGEPGAVAVVRGREVESRLTLPRTPRALWWTRRAGVAMAVGEKVLDLVEIDGGKVGASFPLTFHPGFALFAPDGGRAFVGAAGGSDVAILDLESGRVTASMKTGRGEVKAGKVLGAVLGAAAGVVVTPAATRTMIGLREDGRFLYVLNSFTNDVTLIDVEGGVSTGEIPVGRSPYDLEFLPGGAGMWILSSERMTRLEFATGAVSTVELDTKDRVLGIPFLEPERDRVLVPRPTGLDVLRFTTGEKIGWVGGLPHPVRIHQVRVAPPAS